MSRVRKCSLMWTYKYLFYTNQSTALLPKNNCFTHEVTVYERRKLREFVFLFLIFGLVEQFLLYRKWKSVRKDMFTLNLYLAFMNSRCCFPKLDCVLKNVALTPVNAYYVAWFFFPVIALVFEIYRGGFFTKNISVFKSFTT